MFIEAGCKGFWGRAVPFDMLGLVVTIFFIPMLMLAAIEDVRKGEVPNRLWILALGITPLTLFRFALTGLLPLYAFQALLIFGLVILAFYAGLIGGADGKALLAVALLYPFPEIKEALLTTASILTLLGAFMIMGLQCLSIALLNLHERISHSAVYEQLTPVRLRYWFTRRLYCTPGEQAVWRRVAVPLVFYILLSYLVLLCLVILS